MPPSKQNDMICSESYLINEFDNHIYDNEINIPNKTVEEMIQQLSKQRVPLRTINDYGCILAVYNEAVAQKNVDNES